ncbi:MULTISPECIES: hypothetical protein [unclassified Pseudomonas]|uniref:hypothetical protein n=1 Tax=unclassified Pseudomonas TaxID=196821 RepID=UPI001B328F85|nr:MULTISPECIES: hypothetical protein [unclassified Pseudomonas]MBP5948536.1 hypothetical protein [Pseudomonas sp. P9(2020)]MBZ9560736.1 hypothetical protein [Pseudomonas sp. P116]
MTDNNVKKTRFAGLEQDENGQVRLKSDDVADSDLLGHGTPESGGELNGGGELQAQFAKLKAENAGLTSQLEEVGRLAAGLEAGVLNPVEGEGPAMRLYQTLSGIQSSMQGLADARDAAVSKSDELQKQVDDLLAQAEKDRLAAATDPLEELTVVQIKEQLDAKGVAYKVNDSKPELLALLKANK